MNGRIKPFRWLEVKGCPACGQGAHTHVQRRYTSFNEKGWRFEKVKSNIKEVTLYG